MKAKVSVLILFIVSFTWSCVQEHEPEFSAGEVEFILSAGDSSNWALSRIFVDGNEQNLSNCEQNDILVFQLRSDYLLLNFAPGCAVIQNIKERGDWEVKEEENGALVLTLTFDGMVQSYEILNFNPKIFRIKHRSNSSLEIIEEYTKIEISDN
jgi:hypothetical protein